MATPSSSTTTPSPQLRYMHASAVAPPAAIAPSSEPPDVASERERAVQKFLARAELSKLTRGLRARLSYATYKATHNLAHTTLHDLEAKAQTEAAAPSRVAPGRPSKNYYNNPATQGNSAMATGTSSKPLSRKGTMAPPSSVTASATQSLYTSILAPPPAKRARTIHNPQDPPLPAAVKPKPPSSRTTRSSNASQTQPKSKTRKADKGKRKEVASGKGKQPAHRVNSRGSFGSQNSIVDADVDMKAAATLTSLSRFRNAVSAAASSPRSSLSAGSDPGSLHSFAHFAQSSTRTTTVTSVAPSNEHSFAVPYAPTSTPPPLAGRAQSLSQQSDLRFQGSTPPKGQPRSSTSRTGDPSTPHPPSDTEAADLMLLFATSPSPIRPAAKDRDARDMAAFHTLSGGPAMPGRILFPGSTSTQGEERASGRALRRDHTGGSFSSTMTVATELVGDSPPSSQEHVIGIPVRSYSMLKSSGEDRGNDHRHLEVPDAPNVIPPTPTDQSPVQLLSVPLPQSPQRSISRSSNQLDSVEDSSSSSIASDPKGSSLQAPPTPGATFNFHDFLNVSPSPAAAASTPKLSTNMRADIGRRLFEEHHTVSGASRDGIPAQDSSLGAGINLMNG